eukprot:4269024-Amphidinium_carterae.1
MNHRLSLRQRFRLLEVAVRPSLQWGLDCLRPTQAHSRRVDVLHHNMLHLMCRRGRPAPDEDPLQFWRRSRHAAIAQCSHYEPVSWSRHWTLKVLAFAGHLARYDLYPDEVHLIQAVLNWRGVIWCMETTAGAATPPSASLADSPRVPKLDLAVGTAPGRRLAPHQSPPQPNCPAGHGLEVTRV